MHRDGSGAFLQDGLIRLKMPEMEGSADPGWAEGDIRSVLYPGAAEYDTLPRVRFYGFLFPVRQRDTLAVTLVFIGQKGSLPETLALEPTDLTVYGRSRTVLLQIPEAGKIVMTENRTWKITKQVVLEGGGGEGMAFYPVRRRAYPGKQRRKTLRHAGAAAAGTIAR